MQKKTIILFFTFILISSISITIHAQEWNKNSNINLNNSDFYKNQQTFNEYYSANPLLDKKTYKHFKRLEWTMEQRINEQGVIPAETILNEYEELSAKRKSGALQYGNWESLGPNRVPIWLTQSPYQGGRSGNGRIDCIEFHPTDPNIMYAGAPSGGFWKSIDGGLNWYTTTDNFLSIGITDIITHPNNPDILYISTGDKDGPSPRVMSVGILKSYDGGETWEQTGMDYQLTEQKTIYKLIINPHNPAVLLAATANGIYKTTDSCSTWNQVATSLFKDITFKPGDFNTIYATNYNGAGNAGIYQSNNAGDTFNKLNNTGINYNNVCRIALAVSPADPNSIFALCAEVFPYDLHGLFKSEDNGVTWNKIIDKNNINILGRSADGSTIGDGAQGFYVLSFAVSPVNINEIYVGSINVWRTVDGGTNWELKTHEWPTSYTGVQSTWVDFHEMKFQPNTNIIFAANDGGVLKSQNNGDFWTDLSYGLDIAQFYRLGLSQTNPDMIIGGVQDQFGVLYKEGSWDALYTGEGGEHFIDPVDENILYSSGHFFLGRSDDGGYSYTDILPEPLDGFVFMMPFLINPQNRNSIYYGNGDFFKSTNRGNTWSEIDIPINIRTNNRIEIAPTDSNIIYISTPNRLYKTTNEGINWTPIVNGLPFSGILDVEISRTNSDVVWVTIASYEDGKKVYRTDDGGETWNNISYDLPNVKILSIVEQTGTDKGVYVGTEIGVFYIDNTMNSWVDFSKNLPNVFVSELEIQYEAGKLRAATFGRGMWQSNLYTATSIIPKTQTNEINVYPNPTSDFINIEIGNNKTTVFHFSLYNSLGQMVLRKHFNNAKRIRKIDVQKLPSGIYNLIIKEDNKVQSKKILIK
jgi:photosystem II stability/assembly factor-like uncharacterized protein